MPALRELNASDEPALRRFQCRTLGEPWTAAVQDLIRGHLPDSIAGGHAQGLGLWDDDSLIGVVAWTEVHGNPGAAAIPVVAVAIGHQRRGHGRRLKSEALRRLHGSGHDIVTSAVHEDNEAMLRLNQSFGARFERDSGNPSYLTCVINLDEWTDDSI
ncbi:MAG: GNAT family N-acetyltransferase [Acidimicrobiales bacterium]